MMYYVIAAVVVLVFIAYRAKKLGYFDKKDNANAGIVTDQGLPYPCLLEGSIDMPDHDERIKARNLELIANGHGVSGNEVRDNSVGGGGAPDGGMWLSGAFHFEIDANGQQIPDKSWVTLFNTEHFPVTGGILPNGNINMGSIGGVTIKGSVSSGKPVGRVMHGDSKLHVYGNLNGGYVKI
jgi:hypothetical protein